MKKYKLHDTGDRDTEKRLKRALILIVVALFLFLYSVEAYARPNATVYGRPNDGMFTIKVYVNGIHSATYNVSSSIGSERGMEDGSSWCPTQVTLTAGNNYLQLAGTPFTSQDGGVALGLAPYTRQYELQYDFNIINLPVGYGYRSIAVEDGVQVWANSTGDTSFHLCTDTNDNGMTNYGDYHGSDYYNATFGVYIGPNTYNINFNPNGGKIDNVAYTSGVDTSITFDSTDVYQGSFNNGGQAPGWASSSRTCKTGYTLDGWYDGAGTKVFNADCSKNLDASGYWNVYGQWKHAGDVSLYAHWNQNTYKCYFNANGGSLVDGATNPLTFTYDSNGYCLGCAPYATRRGYNFIGWYGTANGGDKVFDTSGHWYNVNTGVAEWSGWQPDGNWYNGLRTAKWVFASDATVYAHWTQKTYTLYINPNGGSYSDTTGESTKTLKFDSNDNVYLGTPSRTGYIFKGWYTSASGGEAIWDVNGYAIQYQRHTTYWKAGSDWNGSWMGGSLRDWDHMIWNYDGNIRVYAHWEPIWYDQTINYYTYTASGKYDSATHTWVKLGSKKWSAAYDSTFDADSHKADWGNVSGYHWWSINNKNWKVTGTGATNSHYYPNTYRVNVDLNKGSGSTTPSGTKGNFDMEYGTYKDLGSPTRVGYIFNNWKIISDSSTNSSLSNNNFTMGYNNTYPYKDYKDEASVKIAAQWTPITYTVRFNGNGNWNTSQGSYTQQFTYDVSATLTPNKFTRPDNTTYNSLNYIKGYEFIGWGTSATQKTATYTDKQTVKNLKNTDGAVLDLYAIWKKPITLTIDFNGGKFNDSTANQVLNYTMYNSELSHTFDIKQYYGGFKNNRISANKGINNKLTKTDTNGIEYRFLGYSLNKNATVPDSNFDVYSLSRTENYTIRDNTTLYAVWEPVLQMTVQLSVPKNSEIMRLTSDVPVTTTLGNFKIPSGTKSTDIPSSATASVNSATIGTNVTNKDLVTYTVSAKGASNIKFSTAADSRILDIYTHGNNNTWFDKLNTTDKFEYTIDNFSNTTSSFTIPQYIGTTKSYKTSNPESATGTSVYAIKFTCTQPSYYYSKYWNSPETTSVYGILFLNPTLSDDNTNGGIILPPSAVEDGAYEFETILN